MKCDNVNLIVENENLQGKIDDMKEDVSKKKILEFEMEKLKIKEKKFSESSSNFFHNTFKEKFRDENNNNLYQTMEKESLSSLIMKTNLENAKQQLEETKKIYEDIIKNLKENLGDLPQNIAKFVENHKNDKKTNNNNVYKLVKLKTNNVNKLKESYLTMSHSFELKEDKNKEIISNFI